MVPAMWVPWPWLSSGEADSRTKSFQPTTLDANMGPVASIPESTMPTRTPCPVMPSSQARSASMAASPQVLPFALSSTTAGDS
jgi:hypothetical protein